MKRIYWVILIIVILIVFVYFFIVTFLVWPTDSQQYCLMCHYVDFKRQCINCEDYHVNWSSKIMVSDEFVDCIKYCSFIERSVKNSLPENITCETMEYLCKNYLVD